MEIILMENVEKLGRVGDVVKVKDGYARNYLLPRQLGVAATAGNVKRLEKEKVKRLAAYEAEKKEAQLQAEQGMPYRCQCGNFRCRIADFLGADRVGHVLVGEQNLVAGETAMEV